MKVLLKRIHLNGHTIGFHPQTQKLGLRAKQIIPCERTVEEVSFEWSHHRILSSESFSSGSRRVNDPYSELEFRFYSSSFISKNLFNFKSSELR